MCAERSAALRVAREFAMQTEQSDRVRIRFDEASAFEYQDRWMVRVLVGDGRPSPNGDEADLVVRKSDCGTDWHLVLYDY
jgi:hypothetical protein